MGAEDVLIINPVCLQGAGQRAHQLRLAADLGFLINPTQMSSQSVDADVERSGSILQGVLGEYRTGDFGFCFCEVEILLQLMSGKFCLIAGVVHKQC